MATRTVRFGHYLAYGSNDFLGAGAMAVISGWILFFYTTFCGLTAVQAAAIFAIARLFDAVASPLIGFLSDHFHRTAIGRRFGRRRFFILLAVPLLPSFSLMWIDGMSFWYYLVTYVFFEVVYAMELIPYETLAAEMSPDYQREGEVRRRTDFVWPGGCHSRGRAARAHHRSLRQELGGDVLLSRRDLLGDLHAGGARRVHVQLGTAA